MSPAATDSMVKTQSVSATVNLQATYPLAFALALPDDQCQAFAPILAILSARYMRCNIQGFSRSIPYEISASSYIF